jgi:ATP-dependent Clp protease ATP-binding subunit ClpC
MEVPPNFSPKCQFFIAQSKDLAKSLNHPTIKEDHLLLLILQSGELHVLDFLTGYGVNIYDYIDFIITYSNLNKKSQEFKDPEYSPSFKKMLKDAVLCSDKLGDEYVGLEHVFFSIINLKKGSTINFLETQSIDTTKFVKDYVISLKFEDVDTTFSSKSFAEPPTHPQHNPDAQGSLEQFCVNINHLCKQGKIDKIIGRDQEVLRICEVLARKNKNNPMLIGDPGVGKTACIEGLAKLISSGKCPSYLVGHTVYAVDMASMIAGTKYRGQFEQRLKTLIKECLNKDIILFIDEAHTIIGAGSTEGTMDAANILKPYLARGSIKVIGATTYPEFKKSIAKDHALARRFENVFIDEPSKDECYEILLGLKASYEKFHGVRYTQKIIKEIIELSSLYFPNRRFPDKALDIMDECGAKLKIKNMTPPDGVSSVEDMLYDIGMNASEDEESELLKKYEAEYESWQNSLESKVSSGLVHSIISKKSKIPIGNISCNAKFNFKDFDKKINSEVIGQSEAISSISHAISRSKMGLKDFKKPIGSFLFLGSTGVGKTYCAKVLAKNYFGSEANIIRLDMSEYSEKMSSSKLIGSSPGYVGYEEGGVLIEKVKKMPHSIILFDEIEKAHPDIQQLLLQILEEGELEDNVGQKAYFNDCIIVITGNIGAHLLSKSSLGFNPTTKEDKSDLIKQESIKILSPELYNRIDDVVLFNNLDTKSIKKIFDLKIKSLKLKLRKKNIYIKFSNNFSDSICKIAKEEKLGARPIDRIIKNNIENKICESFFSNNFESKVTFDFFIEDEEIKFLYSE